MYHTSNKRNARLPPSEPNAALPDSLGTLQVTALPPPPPPPQPSKRDLPQLAQTIFLAAAQPARHTLRVSSDDVWYGTLARDDIVLGALQVAPPNSVEAEMQLAEELHAQEQAQKQASTLDLDASIFSARKADSDSRSFLCRKAACMERAFEIDWSRCNTERFRALIGREDDAQGGGDAEVNAECADIKAALKQRCGPIYTPL